MAKPRTFTGIKQSVAHEHSLRSSNRWHTTLDGKTDLTPPRDRVVPREMKAVSTARPQFRNDQHGPGYCPETPNNWLRGNGKYPCFDESPKRGKEPR